MTIDDADAHVASIALAVPADRAFAFMADGMAQTHWALGSWNRRHEGDGLFSGVSLFDGRRLFVRLDADPERRLVDYRTGPEADGLRHRVQARVIPGAELGRDPGHCVLSLIVWRPADMAPEVWARTYHAFHTEVHLIKGRLEDQL